ncbi:MAG: DsrE/DsrF/TusD sulfur relay family protein [Candidatus Eutrophobiaceae bacterium]
MHLLILLNSAPWQSQGADTAWHLARAALKKGHRITLFCHQAGAANADARLQAAQDERLGAQRWSILGESERVSLLLCPGAAGTRGLFKDETHLATGFHIASLTRFAELCATADRIIQL